MTINPVRASPIRANLGMQLTATYIKLPSRAVAMEPSTQGTADNQDRKSAAI